ncbi:MAG: RNA-dependent RNA polymerase [Sanya endornavirus 1]|nr:MAG: RNA-dependent RNA polymerase [Sanya endornavirus 1]
MECNEGILLINSNHLDGDQDDVLALLTNLRRTFTYNNNMFDIINSWLMDDSIWPNTGDGFLLTRISERTFNIVRSMLNDDGFCQSGTTYRAFNTELSNRLPPGAVVAIPTHQKMYAYAVNTENGVVYQPQNILSTTLCQDIKICSGIQGWYDEAPLSQANIALADNILNKKLIADMTEKKCIFLPATLCKRFDTYLQQNTISSHINKVSAPHNRDTIAEVVDAIFIEHIIAFTKTKTLTCVGVDAQIFCLNYKRGMRMASQFVTNGDKTILSNFVKNYKLSLESKMSGALSDEQLLSLKESISHFSDVKNFLTETVDGVCYYSLNSKINSVRNTNSFCCTVDNASKYLLERDGKYYTIGDSGVMVKVGHRVGCVLRLGEFQLTCGTNNANHPNLVNPLMSDVKKRHFVSNTGDNLHIHIPNNIFSKLVARCLLDHTTLKDALTYAKALCSTMLYTSDSVHFREEVNVMDIYKYTVLCMNVAWRNRQMVTCLRDASNLGCSTDDKTTSAFLSLVSSAMLEFTRDYNFLTPLLGKLKEFADSIIPESEQDKLLSLVRNNQFLEVCQPYHIIIMRSDDQHESITDNRQDSDDDEVAFHDAESGNDNQNHSATPNNDGNKWVQSTLTTAHSSHGGDSNAPSANESQTDARQASDESNKNRSGKETSVTAIDRTIDIMSQSEMVVTDSNVVNLILAHNTINENKTNNQVNTQENATTTRNMTQLVDNDECIDTQIDSDDVNFATVVPRASSITKCDFCFVHAGSKGDDYPMLSMQKLLVATGATVCALIPADLSDRIGGVKYYEYVDTYRKFTTTASAQRKQGLIKLLLNAVLPKKLFAAHCNKHKTVVAPFFSAEACAVTPIETYIRLVPQWICHNETWDGRTWGVHSATLEVINKIVSRRFSKVPTKVFYCNPSFICPAENNLGFPMHDAEFDYDANTRSFIDFSRRYEHKITVVSAGSMLPPDPISYFQTIFNTLSGPMCWVTGEMSYHSFEFTYANATFNCNKNFMSGNVFIINSIKYKLVLDILHEVHTHGGAGTLSTLLMSNAKIHVHPVAFDQQNNKHYLENVDVTRGDLTTEWKFFHERTVALLAPDSKINPTTLRVQSNKFEINTAQHQLSSDIILSAHNIKSIQLNPNNVDSDCVLTATLQCIDDAMWASNAATLYECYTMSDICDVLHYLISLGLPFQLAHRGVCYVSPGREKSSQISINVDDLLTHASSMSVELGDALKCVVLQEFDWYWFIRFSCITNVNTTMAELNKALTTNNAKEHRFFSVANRKKSNPILLLDATTVPGGFYTNDKLDHNKMYLCLTNVGCVYGLAFKDSISGSSRTLIYTGCTSKARCVAVACTNNIQLFLSAERPIQAIAYGKAALNHSTLKQLRKYGIHMQLADPEFTGDLIVFNTDHDINEDSHELRLLKNASTISMPRHTYDNKFLKQLTQTNNKLRRCIVSGKQMVVMHLKSEHEPTMRACRLIKGINLDTTQHKAFAEWSDKDTISFMHRTFCDKNGKMTGIYNQHSDKPAPTNLSTLLEYLGLVHNSWASDALTAWVQKYHTPAHSCILRNCEEVIDAVDADTMLCRSYIIKGRTIFIAKNFLCLTIPISGAGHNSVMKTKIHGGLLMSAEDYIMVERKQLSALTKRTSNESKQITYNATAMLPMGANTNTMTVDELSTEYNCILIGYTENLDYDCEVIRIDDLPDMLSMEYWAYDDVIPPIVHLPTNKNFTISSRVHPNRMTKSDYMVMEAAPTFARPSLTKTFTSSFNMMSTRYGGYKQLQRKPLDINMEYELFKANYYKQDYLNLLQHYKERIVTVQPSDVLAWIKKHNYPNAAILSLEQQINAGWELSGINLVTASGKVEQTTKLTILTRWFDDVTTRAIVAASYAISAIFSTFFLQMKDRFKSLLSRQYIYVDGMTPIEISDNIKSAGAFCYIVEDDLSKQDRQTSEDILSIEYKIYLDMGADPVTLQFYMTCHKKWRWKGVGLSGYWNAMRLTGQVTTALGNAIANLIVHNRFVARNKDKIAMILFLGDDIVMLCKQLVNVNRHGTETKTLYNMESKISINKHAGGFLSMIVYNINGNTGIGPYYRRLRHRYSVVNYTYKQEDARDKLEARTLSYCFMLGGVSTSRSIAHTINADVIIPNWYDVNTCIEANCTYDRSSETTVLNHLGQLVHMMHERNASYKTIKQWSYKQ